MARVVLSRLHPARRSLLAAVAALLFVALAVLVSVGALTGLDQWSLDHLTPGLSRSGVAAHRLGSLFPIFDPGKEHGHEAISAVAYAVVWLASVIPSAVLVGAAMWWLAARGRGQLAVRLGLAFVLVNVVEVIGKTVITRHALLATSGAERIHIRAFDSSFPSGHMGRAVALAACLVACVPRARLVALVWIAAVAALLVVGGWHTPSDVAGGLALGVMACLIAIRPLGISSRC
jgi:membrane-associated phospholipid phosphatase